MAEEYKRPAILDEMDSYNSAPIEEAGSIMGGILREQNGTAEEASIQEPVVETKKELPNDYLPLNSSIQELTKLVTDKFSNYDRRFDTLSNNFESVRQPVQQPVQQPQMNYDPEAPVTMQHLSQMVQAYTGVNQTSQEAFKNSIITRGQIEYMRYKQDNPGFDMDPREIENTVNQAFAKGQQDMVKQANWRGLFDQSYRPTLDGKLSESSKRIAELEKELETFKKRPVATTTTPVTPAVGKTTSRPSTIDSPVNDTINIKEWKSYNKRGDFKGFGKEMKNKFGIAP